MKPSNVQQAAFLMGNVLVWVIAIVVMGPAPIGLNTFSTTLFRSADFLWFFVYGTLLNALMIYTYAHLALPRYLKTGSVLYLVGINLAYLLGFLLLESGLDFFYAKSIYVLEDYGRPWFSFTEWMQLNLVVDTGLMLVANMYGFTYGWFKSRRKQQELEQAKLRAELMALKHQVSPHFLFNVLNSLYGLAFKNDDEPTAEGIGKLSQLMRYMLYDSNAPEVPLEREVAYIQDFIALQRLRLPRQIEIEFEAAGDLQHRHIAPMILIPFVENAFKHGVSTVRPSRILIWLMGEEDQLHLRVSNPIHPGSKAQSESAPGGIGLVNVRQRLQMLYPGAHQLEIDEANGNYEVNLSITL